MSAAPDAVNGPHAAPGDSVPVPGRAPSPGRVAGYLLVAAQLALVLAVVRAFDVAARNHFFAVLCVAAAGYLVHAWLPPRVRLGFFCAVSLGGLGLVLGWPNAGWVVGIGGGLIALCRLPGPAALRAAAVAVAGGLLAGARAADDLPFWPVLGSMFMFRVVVYLFHQRHARDRPPLALTVAYFFPLPNVSFLFFPIVDFKTFRDTYRDHASWADAQAGVGYFVRGVSHLLAYRVVRYYLLPAPSQLDDLPHVALFLAANYALYLRVSGYFHLITGVFHLFGFGLPRTHRNYFLASSFTDIWRRINIYWKDFLATVVFYPVYFPARRWAGGGGAAVLATGAVFLATWVFHAYQVFWLTGAVSLSVADAGLWAVAGACVAWNLRRDLSRAARPGARAAAPAPGRALAWAARVTGMFALVSVFWAAWNTPVVLLALWGALANPSPADAATVGGVLAVAVLTGAAGRLVADGLSRLGVTPPRVSPLGSALGHAAALVALLALTAPEAAEAFGPRAADAAAVLRRDPLTVAEAARLVQGYYEEITDVGVRPGSWLARLEGRVTPASVASYQSMSRPADPLVDRELIPGWSGEVGGRLLTVNRLGMRDRPDRTAAKPPGTSRVAVVGSSVVMGWGVADDETFTRLLEDRLNGRRGAADPRVEVLNFGTGLSGPIQRRAVLDRTVFGFEPDVVLWVAHQDELALPPRHLAAILRQDAGVAYPYLRETARRAGITAETPDGMMEGLLRPHAREIVLGVYRDAVAACRRRGIRPVWVYLPMPGVVEVTVRTSDLLGLAEEAGFVVVNLEDWAAGRRPAELRVHPGDPHCNALGHRLIAERLDAVLLQRPDLLPRGRP